MLKLLIAAPFALLPFVAIAAVPAEMAQLTYFNGDWRCDGKVDAHGSAPAHTTKAIGHVSAQLDGMWQDISVADTGPSGKTFRIVIHQGYDNAKKQFVSVNVTNTGDYEIQTSRGWDGDTMVFEKNAGSGEGLDRDKFVKKGPNEFVHIGEWQGKDGSWKKMIEHTCHRAK